MNVLVAFSTLSLFISICSSTFVSPSTFLDSRLAKGLWVPKSDMSEVENLFEGGWVWTESGNLVVTHVCRAKSGGSFDKVSIEPGELLNGTCYISGAPSLEYPSGVKHLRDYEVLMKIPNEIYEWVGFDSEYGYVPNGGVIGGIGPNYEPVLVCRKLYNGTAGDVRKSKAVLGKFVPKDGKCYYELEVGGSWIKWDLSFSSESFQLLVLKIRADDPCREPREGEIHKKVL